MKAEIDQKHGPNFEIIVFHKSNMYSIHHFNICFQGLHVYVSLRICRLALTESFQTNLI